VRRCFVLIASGRDTRYIERGTVTAIRSITLSNPGIPIVVLHHDLSPEQEQLLAGAVVKRVDLPSFQLSGWSRLSRPDIPDTCYLSMCLEVITDFDVAVYIDADTVVLEPLDDVFVMKAPAVARVMDDYPLVEHFEDGERILLQESVNAVYAINNGLVRFDLRYWRANSLLRQAEELFRKYGPDAFRLTDQSLLNLIVYKTGTLQPISRIYNFCRYPDMLLMEHTLVKNDFGWIAPKIVEGVVKVVHWTGPLKPWSADVDRFENSRLALCLDCYEQFGAD